MAVRFQFEWTGLGGGPYLTTIYLTDDVLPDVQAAHDALIALWTAFAPNIVNDLVIASSPEAYVFSSPSTVTDVLSVVPASVSGTNTGAMAARATQGLIRLRTGTFSGNRRVLGKIFMAGVEQDHIGGTTGQPTAAYLEDLTAFGTDLVSLGVQVPSRVLDVFAPAVAADGWNEFAVLRSRRD